jgi:hypothetical protein
MIYNYNYENDSNSIIDEFDNNSIKKYICKSCNNQTNILKKKSIYSTGDFLCLNCWDKFYKRLNQI